MELEDCELEVLAFGLALDFVFNSQRPKFGDLFLIVGFENPNFPPESRDFEKLEGLGFEQIDDYFGIRNNEEHGDDVKIWLYPVADGDTVEHHPGPFDAVRLNYEVLRNDPKNAKLFEQCVEALATSLDVTPMLEGKPVTLGEVKEVIEQVLSYCRTELNVEPGSEDALGMDY
jgi:hypothetical protein